MRTLTWTLMPMLALAESSSNSSLLWGAYRPNLYFGLRPRLPSSLTTALLWTRVEDFTSIQNNLRYTCEQSEGMAGYGWDTYDPRAGGVQTIRDKGNGVDIETSFVKFGNGDSWGARIRGTVREDVDPGSMGGEVKTGVWFTVGMEGLGGVEIEDVEAGEEKGFEGDVVLTGSSDGLGEFRLKITEPGDGNVHPRPVHPASEEKPLDRTFVHSMQVPEEALWQAKPILFSSMKTTIDAYIAEYTEQKMPPPWQTYTIQNRPGTGNMHAIQKVFEGDFEFDVLYHPTASAAAPPTSADLTTAIDKVTIEFGKKYLDILAPQAPFNKGGEQWTKFSQTLFSNLVGGIGYFHGEQLIDRSADPAYDEENEGFWLETAESRAQNAQKMEGPYSLFTSIPSRPFFPRGFLWDEGFHLLAVVDWDPELCMQILTSWFETMDQDGWIPREQILGSEARTKVPQEFQVQYPHYANPPTLFMVIDALLARVGSSPGEEVEKGQLKEWLKQLYPLLQRHFAWYRRTQAGDLVSYERGDDLFSKKEGYRWRGRTPQHILTSGLDDYPRAQPPHPGELHLDLMSWMGLMARSMTSLAEFIGEADDSKTYGKVAEAIERNTEDLHWSKEDKMFCDVTVDDYEDSVHVCHAGYISLFPFMTGMLGPDSPRLGATLDLIADEERLWSPFGIRSLSKSDELYGTEENYWRGPVWMNMNYLVVRQLLYIATTPGPQKARATSMYSALRKNLVDTVYRGWSETGFAWEQYNSETGQGQRTQHFTGWTSLIVKIMGMPDLSGGKAGQERVRDEL